MKNSVLAVLCLATAIISTSCAFNKQKTPQQTNSASSATTTTSPSPTLEAQPGGIRVGQAVGSYTAKGEVVELKYAYAGRAVRFGNESIVIFLTDKPIPSDKVAAEVKEPAMLESEQIRGLEYVIDGDGMWVRFHPSQYQESTSNKLKDYKVEGDVVSGVDEGNDLSSGKYSRSVKFSASIVK